jgi:hypothetical protein
MIQFVFEKYFLYPLEGVSEGNSGGWPQLVTGQL